MPRAPKLCGREGCIELVRGQTYCDLHAKERGWPRGTGSTRTNTASHRQRRLRILKRDNYRCQLQYPGVCTDVASVVDHRQALGLGGQDSIMLFSLVTVLEFCTAVCINRGVSQNNFRGFWTRLFVKNAAAVALSANDLCLVRGHRVADDVSAYTVDFYLIGLGANLGDGEGCADHCGYRKPCASRCQK
jgi:5-methylcytosine-specific restriction protein A